MATIKTITATINGQSYNLTYNNVTRKYEATVTAPSTTSYNNNAGHYFPVTLKATDTAGNMTTINDTDSKFGANLKLRVKETVKPVINITSIGANAIITNNSPVIEFTVTDGGAGVNKSTVVLKVNNSPVVLSEPVVISNGFKYSYATSGLKDGVNNISIDCKDFDDNVAVTANRSFTVDTVPPTLNVTAPVNAFITNKASCNVVGTNNDVTTSPVTVKISVNGTDAGAVTVGGGGTFTKAITLTEGSNNIQITSTDRAGKSTTVTRTVELDTKPPVFTSVSVAPNPVNTGVTYVISVEVNS